MLLKVVGAVAPLCIRRAPSAPKLVWILGLVDFYTCRSDTRVTSRDATEMKQMQFQMEMQKMVSVCMSQMLAWFSLAKLEEYTHTHM